MTTMRNDKPGAMTLAEMREDYDWIEAFGFAGQPSAYNGPDIRRAHPTEQDTSLAPFTLDDVVSIDALAEGENDEESWLAMGTLKDGRWFLLDAWCDYTGWDCQAGGTATVAPDRETLVTLGTTPEQRQRLGIAAQTRSNDREEA